MVLASWIAVTAVTAGVLCADPPDAGVPVFGTTVVLPLGLKGEIYFLKKNTSALPDFEGLRSEGAIYTKQLNVPPQDFKLGFPGITKRTEWFAIDYNGKIWLTSTGMYRFRLTSDDGAVLYVDDQLIIDNDGVHQPEKRRATIRLSAGIHRLRVSYFQGPRFTVALVLEVARPEDPDYRIFNSDEFKPPSTNPEDWPATTPDKEPPPG